MFMVLVTISAASARLMELACASCSTEDSAFVAFAADIPFLVRFSSAWAASVAVYLVVLPSL